MAGSNLVCSQTNFFLTILFFQFPANAISMYVLWRSAFKHIKIVTMTQISMSFFPLQCSRTKLVYWFCHDTSEISLPIRDLYECLWMLLKLIIILSNLATFFRSCQCLCAVQQVRWLKCVFCFFFWDDNDTRNFLQFILRLDFWKLTDNVLGYWQVWWNISRYIFL